MTVQQWAVEHRCETDDETRLANELFRHLSEFSTINRAEHALCVARVVLDARFRAAEGGQV